MEGLEGLREMMVVSLRRAAFLLAAEQEGAACSLASAPGEAPPCLVCVCPVCVLYYTATPLWPKRTFYP